MTTTTLQLDAKVRPISVGTASDLLELVKPRMNLLVLSTTMVGFYMAARHHADWLRLPGALMGTAFCAAGASAMNQVMERRRDGLMPRTRNRPLPMRRLRPAQALGFGIGMALGGVAMLAILVNPLTAFLGALTLFSYVAIYTPLKPLTPWNTLVGALPGAIPPVMGWTAVRGELDAQAFCLLAILFVWQIPHFMAIAILYKQDYAAAGFKMLPVVDSTLAETGRQIVLFSIALVPVSMLPSFLGMTSINYITPAVLLGLAFLAFGMECASSGTRREARKLFIASIIYLPVLLGFMMFNRIVN
jgi:protoheme IX farnesyltransferase